LILGVCNGFQILIKAGVLLADDERGEPPATLTGNDSGKFEDRWVRMQAAGGKCVFLQGVDSLYLPIAHAEGKFVARDETTLRRLEANGQLVLRYVSQSGDELAPVGYPDNPNGSQGNVAGVCDETGRVFGLMPHPERHIDPTHHPRWTRGEGQAPPDGVVIFQNAVKWFE
jgi:phosphoribosylformylglycinamidine synthase